LQPGRVTRYSWDSSRIGLHGPLQQFEVGERRQRFPATKASQSPFPRWEAFAMTYQVEGPVHATPGLVARRVAALALLAMSGGLLASACADNESSVFIYVNKAPTVSTDAPGTCTFECEPEGEFLGRGTVDVLFPQPSFPGHLVVGNQVITQKVATKLRTETSRIQLYEAEVRVSDVGGNALTYSDGSEVAYVYPLSGSIDPADTGGSGWGCATVPLLDGGALDSARARALAQGDFDVISTVIVRGRTLGGQELESGEWAFPINICVGCTCRNVSVRSCCANPAAAACADLDEAPLAGGCEGVPAVVDCRLLGMTCEDYIAAAR
jgi:hypothetical protein